MRIHSLEINAYGPFPGTISLDFNELNEAGIFLLNGPTGSGKSSILDAICYGLYGSTSSGRTDLKSRFAEPEAQPWVKLECSVAGKRYRIFRSPEYLRPKKRGSGLTREQASVTIEVFDAKVGNWEEDASVTRHKDAGDFMYSVIGLTAQQFNQVMLLPQGKFQQFLVAKSADREELLKKLFSTREFERIQQILDDKAKGAEAKAAEAEAAVRSLIERAQRAEKAADITMARQLLVGDIGATLPEATSTGEQPLKPDWLELTSEGALSRTQQLRDDVTELNRAATDLTDTAAAEIAELRQQETSLGELQRHWVQYRDLQAQEEELDRQREQITEAEASLALHRRAATVLPMMTAQARAAAAVKDAQDRLETVTGRLETAIENALAGIEVAAPEYTLLTDVQNLADYGATEDQVAELTRQIENLNDFARSDRQLTSLVQERKQAETKTEGLQKALDAAHTAVTKQECKLAELSARFTALDDAGAQLTAAQVQRDTAETAVTLARKLEQSRSRVAAAEAAAMTTNEARRAAGVRAENLQQQRFDRAAQTLASNLEPGQPCAVCGSREHPAPATFTEEVPAISAEEVKDALAARDQAEAKAEAALLELTSAETSVAELIAAGASDLNSALIQLQQAQESLTEKQRNMQRRSELAQERAAAEADHERLKAKENSCTTAVAQHRALLNSLTERIEKDEAELEAHRQTTGFTQRATALSQVAQSLVSALSIQQEAQRLKKAHIRAEEELTQVVQNSGFSSGAEAVEGHLSSERERALTMLVQTHQQKRFTLDGLLASNAMTGIAARVQQGEESPTPQALQEVIQLRQSREQARDTYLRTGVRLSAAYQELTSIVTELTTSLSHNQKLLVRALRARSLAATATAAKSSDNALRMTLTTYVLAAQLEEVAQAASEHLEQMTHGRYTLEHTDDAEGRGSKSGLGLTVRDAWHGATRHPSTLSGGETFMASLCLALGLADVVQRTNGGIEIDTLFVDEGFGSLDEETLEEVMTTLDSLREGGRVIGLISHVAEMKNRITRQVQLTTSPTGSSLKPETGAV